MRQILFFFFCIILCASSNAAGLLNNIVPVPRQVNISEGYYTLPSQIKIRLKGNDRDQIRLAAFQLAECWKENFGVEPVVLDAASKEAAHLVFYINTRMTADSLALIGNNVGEGYFLNINESGIVVEAPSAKGLFYGTMSLVQLFDKASDSKVQMGAIADFPVMQMRGISDDISRGQVSTLDNFKRIIKFMARYKMNSYFLYLEDMVQLESYPSIGKGRGALSKKDIIELDKYAKSYYVDLIPIFQTLGHYENILNQPEFLHLAEYPGAASLCITCDSVYLFLDKVLAEVSSMFSSDVLHIGADESWDVGLGKSKAYVDKVGIAAAHAAHYDKVLQLCRKYKKKPMMYGDIILDHPEILTMLSKDVTIMNWQYDDQYAYPSTKKLKDAGFNTLVSPAVWNFTTSFPAYTIALPNIQYLTKSGIEQGSLGSITSQWGDYGAETFRELNLFGYAWSAQCSWSYEKNDLYTFSKNYFADFFGTTDSQLPRLYQYFSGVFSTLIWNEVWQHPMLPLKENKWLAYGLNPSARTSFQNWTLPGIVDQLQDLKSKVKRNAAHLDYLIFIVQLNKWFSNKTQMQSYLQDAQKDRPVRMDKLADLIDANISAIPQLKGEYRKLWLRTNRPENLNLIEDKFDRMLSNVKQIKEQVRRESFKPPLIESKFIFAKDSDTSFARVVTFRKNFSVKGDITRAPIQIIGDSYCKLYVNGKLATQVYTTASLSLTTEYNRVKMLDIASLLNSGENTIEIIAESFKKKPAAGCNFIGVVACSGGDVELYSDEKWEAKPLGKNEWQKAVTNKNTLKITAPNFATNTPSWIER